MKRYMLYGLYSLTGIIVLSAIAFKVLQPIQVVPRIRLAPGFILVDQDGNNLTNEDLRGQFVLYNFRYTRCPEPCSNLNQTMREIQTRINEAELGDIPMSFVTVSFDPEYDTPEVLKLYSKTIGADTSQWKFATSRDADLLKHIIGGGFEAYYDLQDKGSYIFDPKFVLVDGWGIIRGEYRYQTLTPDTDRILRHIRVLADEVHNSEGTVSLAYEAAHFFLCYTQ